MKPKTRNVKAWAVVVFGELIQAYSTETEAERFKRLANGFGHKDIKVVPCIITYKV